MPAQNSPNHHASMLHAFDYTIVRVVPNVARQEFVNVGVILFCKSKCFLDAQMDLALTRVQALSPQTNIAPICTRLELAIAICHSTQTIDAVQDWPQSERFKWLAAPSSTLIQAAPIHNGLCSDPRTRLDALFQLLVA